MRLLSFILMTVVVMVTARPKAGQFRFLHLVESETRFLMTDIVNETRGLVEADLHVGHVFQL